MGHLYLGSLMRNFGAKLGLFSRHIDLGPIWPFSGHIISGLPEDLFDQSWGPVETILSHLEAVLGSLGAVLARFWAISRKS